MDYLWFKSAQNLAASQRALLRYLKHVTITMIAVSVIYAVCWIANWTAYFMEYWNTVSLWFDKTGTVSVLTFNSCVNPVLYSMRMKIREHDRDMLFCKKRGRATSQKAEMRARPATGQSEEL